MAGRNLFAEESPPIKGRNLFASEKPEAAPEHKAWYDKDIVDRSPETVARRAAMGEDEPAQKSWKQTGMEMLAPIVGVEKTIAEAPLALSQLVTKPFGGGELATDAINQLEEWNKPFKEAAPKGNAAGEMAGYVIPATKLADSLGIATKAPTDASGIARLLNIGKVGAIGGAESAALTPETDPDLKGSKYVGEKAKQTAINTLIGALPGYLGAGYGMAEKYIGGKFSSANEIAQALKSAGKVSKSAGTAAQETARSAALGEAAEKTKLVQAESRGEKAISGLEGVRQSTIGGKYQTVPSTTTRIGEEGIRQPAIRNIESLKSVRSSNADRNAQEAFGLARQKEASGNRIQKNTAFKHLINKIEEIKKNSPAEQRNALDRLKNDLLYNTPPSSVEVASPSAGLREKLGKSAFPSKTVTAKGIPANFDQIEIIRRKLGDKGFGLPEEGYSAIDQQQSAELYKDLSAAMKNHVPEYEKFLSQYAADSDRLAAAHSSVGRALLNEADVGGNKTIYTTDPASLPSKVFKSPQAFNDFLSASGGNRTAAEKAAEAYYASKIKGKSADEISKFILDEHVNGALSEMPNVRAKLENDVLEPLRRNEIEQQAAKSKSGDYARIREENQKASEAIADSMNRLDKLPFAQQKTRIYKLVDILKESNLVNKSEVNMLEDDLNNAVTKEKESALKSKVAKYVLRGGVAGTLWYAFHRKAWEVLQ